MIDNPEQDKGPEQDYDSFVLKAPERRNYLIDPPMARTVFLAGSIEMGEAEDWQERVTKTLINNYLYVFNPRRDDWDSTWEQDIKDPNFFEQVRWELDHLDSANYILMYFSPETKAPISLLELGLYADSGKIVVCCPPGFWRRGNVQMVAAKYNIPLFDDLDAAARYIVWHNESRLKRAQGRFERAR